MIQLLPFLFIVVTLLFTAGIIGAILARSLYTQEQGLRAMLFPFIPLFLSGCCEALRVIANLIGDNSPILGDIATTVRMLNGLGWFLVLHSHLQLHGILGKRKRLTIPVVLLTAAACLFYIISAVLGHREPAQTIGLSFMSITGLYAATSSIFVLRKKITLWPASLAGIRMGIFALIAYPSSLLSERFGFVYPFIDPNRSGFEQIYPIFMAVIAALAIPAIISKGKGLREKVEYVVLESLTPREKEVIDFLMENLSLKEIASSLHLSVPTIKSHANSVYRKLSVSSRKELQNLHFGN